MMTFAFTAMDQIVNQMAKIHYMFGGQAPFPAGFRASTGGGRSAGATLAEPAPDVHEPGRAEAGDAVESVRRQGTDEERDPRQQPGGFFEDQILAASQQRFPVPEEEYVVPIGEADVKREGSDVTVVAISKMVPEALRAAEELAGEGISLEVVDRGRWCRWIRLPSGVRCRRRGGW